MLKKKSFDAVRMKRDVQRVMQAKTAKMSREEELAYYQSLAQKFAREKPAGRKGR